MIKQKKLKEMMEKMAGTKEEKIILQPVILNSSNFNSFLKENKYAVVDFWAEWCAPCKMMAPVIDELAKEYAGEIVFGKINTDEAQNIANRYAITAIPTLIFFRDGKPVDKLVGAVPKGEILRWIRRNKGK